MNHERQPRLPVAVFLFHKLIVTGAAAKLGGKTLLEKRVKIAIRIIHALAGEFVKTSDPMKVQIQSKVPDSAAALSLIHHSIVTVFNVDVQHWVQVGKGGEEKRVNRGSVSVGCPGSLDHGKSVSWDVNIIRPKGVSTPGTYFAQT